jgi:signal transduction histidine kinase
MFVLMPLVQSVVGNYALPAADKHIRLSVNGAEDAECFADKHLTLQVLDNLISNAVKYSSFGSPVRVFVQTALSPELQELSARQHIAEITSPHIFVIVHDSGPGITPDDRKKLFRKFTRLSAKPTGGEHSTGLGLSIAKRLVEAMHGNIWCLSEGSNGAVFILALPINDWRRSGQM